MAISVKSGNIVITGIKNLVVKSKQAPYNVIGDLDKLVDINLSDEQASSELRGGYGNPVILKIYGDRTTKLTSSIATFSTELLRIMTGQETVVRELAMPVIEKNLVISGNAVTIDKVPSAGKAMSVFVADDYGRNATLLTKSSTASTPTQYAITGQQITVNAAVTGKLNVYYYADEEVESIEAKGGVHPIYEMEGICVCTDVDTGKIYKGVIHIPSAQIASSYSISGRNSSDTPDNQSIEIDCLADKAMGYPYALRLLEVQNDNF